MISFAFEKEQKISQEKDQSAMRIKLQFQFCSYLLIILQEKVRDG